MSSDPMLDLSRVPPPDIIESLDYDALLAELKSSLIHAFPELTEVLSLESEPLVQLMQAFTYRELLLRARLNEVTRANMLATATGTSLDAIGARYFIERLGRSDDKGEKSGGYEDDERFRHRIQMAFNGLNTAGSESAYRFHGLSADENVLDVDVQSPSPCNVAVTVLSGEPDADGKPACIPSDTLLEKVRGYFGLTPDGSAVSESVSQTIRPLGDRVEVLPASVKPFTLDARLTLLPEFDKATSLANAEQALNAFLETRLRLGRKVPLSGLYAALQQSGIDGAELVEPASDIQVAPGQVARCVGLAISEA